MIDRESLRKAAIKTCWQSGNLYYKLHAAQKVIYDDIKKAQPNANIILFISRQWGKSYLALILAIEYCIKNPGARVIYAAPTKDQMENIMDNSWTKIPEDAPPGLVKMTRSTKKWMVGKSQLCVGSLDSTHVDKLRGTSADLIITEEGGFVDSESFQKAYLSVLLPQLITTNSRCIHCTTPSEDENHFIHTSIVPACEETNTFFTRDIYSNPLTTPETIERMIREVGGVDTAIWRREYLAQICRDEEILVIPAFKEFVHVSPIILSIPELAWPTLTIDFGGVIDFTVGLLTYFDEILKKVIVVDEIKFPTHTPTQDIIDDLNAFLIKNRVGSHPNLICWADAPGQILVDLQKWKPFNLPTKIDFAGQIVHLNSAFYRDEILINKQCLLLIKTLRVGMFNKQRNNFSRNKELGHMDAIAAMMYAERMQSRQKYQITQIHKALKDPENYYVPKYLRPQTPNEEMAAALQPSKSKRRY